MSKFCELLKTTIAAMALLCVTGIAGAHDHINLERGIPVQLEDAYPTAYMNRELQGIARYEQTRDDKHRYELIPVFEYGIIRNGEFEIQAPFRLGTASTQGSGDINVSALYNFFYEGLLLPAVAVSGGLNVPTGKGSRGVDPSASLLLTKTLSRGTFFHRVHFNARWHHNNNSTAEQRINRYEFALGYQVRLDPNNQILLSGLRRQELEKGKEVNLVELGLRHQWNPLWVLAAGVGVGIKQESPEIIGTLAFQRALNFFYGSP